MQIIAQPYAHRFRRLAAIMLTLIMCMGVATVVPSSRALLVNRFYCNSEFNGYYPPGEDAFRRTYGITGAWQTISGASNLLTIPHDPRMTPIQEDVLLTFISNQYYGDGEYNHSYYYLWREFCGMSSPVMWFNDVEGPLHYSDPLTPSNTATQSE